jgi:hypothetical protein
MSPKQTEQINKKKWLNVDAAINGWLSLDTYIIFLQLQNIFFRYIDKKKIVVTKAVIRRRACNTMPTKWTKRQTMIHNKLQRKV